MPSRATFAKLKTKEPVTVGMSKTDIQSWISSSDVGMEDGDQESVWQRDRALNDWPRALEYAQRVLLNNKTKSRIGFLRNEIMSLAKHAGTGLLLESVCCLTS